MTGFILRVALAAAVGTAWLAASAAPSSYIWRLPPGIAPPPVPADNPMSPAKVELGRRLFYDADLSIDGTTSCATCHEQHRAFTEGNPTHPGVQGARGRRNVMALANVGYLTPLTWAKPNLHDLESQVPVPVLGNQPVEMGMGGKEQVLADRLGGDPCYRQMFAAAFPGDGTIDMSSVAKAIAAFERTLISFDSPYDRYRRGNQSALEASARRGETLFFGDRFHCASCHSGPNFTDEKYHNVGLPDASGVTARDLGLSEESNDPRDDGRFRTPGLRNVSLTGPYMHNGSIKSLADAVRAHSVPDGGTGANPLRDSGLATIDIGDADLADLVAFLGALTDKSFVADPRFALPKTACGKKL